MAKTSGEDLMKQDFQAEGQESPATYSATTDTTETTEATQNTGAPESTKLEEPTTKAMSRNNIFIAVGLLVVCGIAIAYFWINSGKKSTESVNNPFEETKPTTSASIEAPSLRIHGGGPATGSAVNLPTTIIEKVPEPGPPPQPSLLPVTKPTPPTALALEQEAAASAASNAQNIKYDARVKSSMMLQGGSKSANPRPAGEAPKLDENTVNGDFRPKITVAASAQVTQVGDLSTTITQGKMLDSVLETPINTIYPGPIRAIISRDVFSDKGSNVLIPKGSRVIGTLKGGYTPGVTRVAVNWDRIILPSGYDIAIASAPGVNKLGMIGLEGTVNRQFMEIVGSAALLSIINISAANIVERYFKIQPNTVTTSNSETVGTVVRTQSAQSPTQQAAQNEINNLSNVTKDWVKQNFLPTPYIVINQGTRIKIFVNQDIRFPKNLNEGANVITR